MIPPLTPSPCLPSPPMACWELVRPFPQTSDGLSTNPLVG
uniref:Uncharacterized protein n=1 Tax=Anguilla anguilla TaxID=7936 RepID=A0A0E9VFE5_ANGAN